MKTFALPLFGLSALIASATAFGNDTSFPMINVDEIETNTAVGSYVSFKGAEALELLKVLPQVSTTGGPELAKHRRALLVRSPGYQVFISCSDYEIVDGQLVFGTNPTCSINFGRLNGDFDGFPFKAESVCK